MVTHGCVAAIWNVCTCMYAPWCTMHACIIVTVLELLEVLPSAAASHRILTTWSPLPSDVVHVDRMKCCDRHARASHVHANRSGCSWPKSLQHASVNIHIGLVTAFQLGTSRADQLKSIDCSTVKLGWVPCDRPVLRSKAYQHNLLDKASKHWISTWNAHSVCMPFLA